MLQQKMTTASHATVETPAEGEEKPHEKNV
jgi:hypothetical protein